MKAFLTAICAVLISTSIASAQFCGFSGCGVPSAGFGYGYGIQATQVPPAFVPLNVGGCGYSQTLLVQTALAGGYSLNSFGVYSGGVGYGVGGFGVRSVGVNYGAVGVGVGVRSRIPVNRVFVAQPSVRVRVRVR